MQNFNNTDEELLSLAHKHIPFGDIFLAEELQADTQMLIHPDHFTGELNWIKWQFLTRVLMTEANFLTG